MFTYPIVYFPMTPGSGGGGSYVLPTASASELGGVKAKTKTKEAVIDANSGLWVLVSPQVQSDPGETDTLAKRIPNCLRKKGKCGIINKKDKSI